MKSMFTVLCRYYTVTLPRFKQYNLRHWSTSFWLTEIMRFLEFLNNWHYTFSTPALTQFPMHLIFRIAKTSFLLKRNRMKQWIYKNDRLFD